jgi:hypothetical protein
MQRIIDAGDNHEDEDAEGLSSIEEILGSRTQKSPKAYPNYRDGQNAGTQKTKIMKFPWEFRVERTYTKINGVMKYLHPLMKYPSLGLKRRTES